MRKYSILLLILSLIFLSGCNLFEKEPSNVKTQTPVQYLDVYDKNKDFDPIDIDNPSNYPFLAKFMANQLSKRSVPKTFSFDSTAHQQVLMAVDATGHQEYRDAVVNEYFHQYSNTDGFAGGYSIVSGDLEMLSYGSIKKEENKFKSEVNTEINIDGLPSIHDMEYYDLDEGEQTYLRELNNYFRGETNLIYDLIYGDSIEGIEANGFEDFDKDTISCDLKFERDSLYNVSAVEGTINVQVNYHDYIQIKDEKRLTIFKFVIKDYCLIDLNIYMDDEENMIFDYHSKGCELDLSIYDNLMSDDNYRKCVLIKKDKCYISLNEFNDKSENAIINIPSHIHCYPVVDVSGACNFDSITIPYTVTNISNFINYRDSNYGDIYIYGENVKITESFNTRGILGSIIFYGKVSSIKESFKCERIKNDSSIIFNKGVEEIDNSFNTYSNDASDIDKLILNISSSNIKNSFERIRPKYYKGDGELLGHCINSSMIEEAVISGKKVGGLSRTPIKKVTLADTIEVIEDCAFSDCTNLESITIPENVTKIGFNAFADCTNLSVITILCKKADFDESAFSDCKKLYKVNIKDINNWFNFTFDSYTSNPIYYSHYLYISDKELEELVVPDDITKINDNAFVGLNTLKKVVFSENVTSIGEYAFAYCNSLKTVIFNTKGNKGIEYIASYAFYNIKSQLLELPKTLKYLSYNFFISKDDKNCLKYDGTLEEFKQIKAKEEALYYPVFNYVEVSEGKFYFDSEFDDWFPYLEE